MKGYICAGKELVLSPTSEHLAGVSNPRLRKDPRNIFCKGLFPKIVIQPSTSANSNNSPGTTQPIPQVKNDS